MCLAIFSQIQIADRCARCAFKRVDGTSLYLTAALHFTLSKRACSIGTREWPSPLSALGHGPLIPLSDTEYRVTLGAILGISRRLAGSASAIRQNPAVFAKRHQRWRLYRCLPAHASDRSSSLRVSSRIERRVRYPTKCAQPHN